MEVHFIDVGCGNMTLIVLPDKTVFMYDCNITEDNQDKVLPYVDGVIGRGTAIDVFVNSHRDAEHMRNIRLLHASHPIKELWDTGVSGTTTDTPEYEAYMDFRRSVTCRELECFKQYVYGVATVWCLNSKRKGYRDANEQSAVLKLVHGEHSVMLAGDTNYRPWKDWRSRILSYHTFKCDILLASHHGSYDFFDEPSSTQPYEYHLSLIRPQMTLVSVGPNPHGLPDPKAIGLYEKHSSGCKDGCKIATTQERGTMKLLLPASGDWRVLYGQ